MNAARRNAIITGSASGLGRALAVRLARDGWTIALVDRNEAGNAETLERVRAAGGDGLLHAMDVASADAWTALRDRLLGEWRQLDLLVNNAGVAGSGDVGDYALDDWQWIVDINLMAGVYGCHTFVPWLKRNPAGAHIINTASLAAIANRPGMAGYNVTKAGMLSLSETLYGELKAHNVGVTVLCPAFFQTNLLEQGRLTDSDRKMGAKMMRDASFTADDVAEAAVRAIERKQLHVVMPRYGRTIWRLKRWLPMYVINKLAGEHAKQHPPAARA